MPDRPISKWALEEAKELAFHATAHCPIINIESACSCEDHAAEKIARALDAAAAKGAEDALGAGYISTVASQTLVKVCVNSAVARERERWAEIAKAVDMLLEADEAVLQAVSPKEQADAERLLVLALTKGHGARQALVEAVQ